MRIHLARCNTSRIVAGPITEKCLSPRLDFLYQTRTLQRWYQDQAGTPSDSERRLPSRRSVDSLVQRSVFQGRRASRDDERVRGADQPSSPRYQRNLLAPAARRSGVGLSGADRLFGSATVPKPGFRSKPDATTSYRSLDTEDMDFRRKPDATPNYRNRDAESTDFLPFESNRNKLDSIASDSTLPKPGSRRKPDGTPSYRSRDTENTDFIPFEINRDELDSIASGPTLTESERRVFEQLRSLDDNNKKPKEDGIEEAEPPPVPRAERKTAASSLDAILDAALDETPSELIDEAEPRGRTTTQERRKTTDEVVGEPTPVRYVSSEKRALHASVPVREHERERIMTLIDECRTDHAVWKVLEDSILGPVASLGLDAADQSTRGVSRRRRQKSSTVAITVPVEAQLETIGPNLASLLAHTATTLRTKYPSSPLLLALIPRLRETGPSAFALGSSTVLYNECLAQIVDERGDFLAVTDLIAEMDREVISSDDTTTMLLKRLVEEADRMRSGRYGEAARDFIATDRIRKAIIEVIKNLKRWEASRNTAKRRALSLVEPSGDI